MELTFANGKFNDPVATAMLNDDQLTLAGFWEMHAAWSQATFGSDQERGPIGPLKHLAKEVVETLDQVDCCVRESQNDPDAKAYLLEEFADLLFLVFDATRRAGFTYEDLRVAVNKKLRKNISRKWNKPTTDEPVEHMRENE